MCIEALPALASPVCTVHCSQQRGNLWCIAEEQACAIQPCLVVQHPVLIILIPCVQDDLQPVSEELQSCAMQPCLWIQQQPVLMILILYLQDDLQPVSKTLQACAIQPGLYQPRFIAHDT